MDADREIDSGSEEDPSSVGGIASLYRRLSAFRELVEQKTALREEQDELVARLEDMAEEVEPELGDPVAEAIRLLLESEQVRAIQFKQLETRFDRVVDSYMVASLDLLERLRPPGVVDPEED